MSKTNYAFEAKNGKKRTTYYVIAPTMKAAFTKFFTKYPNAKVDNVWTSRREALPVIVK